MMSVPNGVEGEFNHYIFKVLTKTGDASGDKFIVKSKLKKKENGIPDVKLSENPLLVVPEKVTFTKDDRQLRPLILIKTESDDYT